MAVLKPGNRRILLIGVFFFLFSILPAADGYALEQAASIRGFIDSGADAVSFELEGCRINALSPDSAFPGEEVTVYGWGFGDDPGYAILSGLKINPAGWSDKRVTFFVPADGFSGKLYMRTAEQVTSNKTEFTVRRELPDGQFEPFNARIADTGLLGPAFLVESDGSHLYCLSGFEALSTYRLVENGPHEYLGQVFLPQRVGDLKTLGGYLFCAGDHGLFIFETEHLGEGGADWAAAAACGSNISLDIREIDLPGSGILVALCEHVPAEGSDQLRVHLYLFESGELLKLGVFSRTVGPAERQTAIALDPLNPKVYAAGYETFLGSNKYILEIDISDLNQPVLNHREPLAGQAVNDMSARGDLLWTAAMFPDNDSFRAYRLQPGEDYLQADFILDAETTTNRLAVVSDSLAVGSSWFGAEPAMFLWNTFNPVDFPDPALNTIDWAFDVAGSPAPAGGYDGRIFVADEWGGFLTFYYTEASPPVIHTPDDYQQVPSTAWSSGLYIAGDRVYVVGRGSGPWSMDRHDLANRAEWKSVEWDWSAEHPQPAPITSISAKDEPGLGTVIVSGAHDEAFDWSDKALAILYLETEEEIVPLAMSEELNPPGVPPLFGCSTDLDWSEDDLVYMSTGAGGFRGFIVDPWEPSVTLHDSCKTEGFATEDFGIWNAPSRIARYSDDGDPKLLIGAVANFLGGISHGFYIYDLAYPEGVPDRYDPHRPISVKKESRLDCLLWTFTLGMDVTPSGLVGLATSKGAAVFHPSWLEDLNSMFTWVAWSHIEIPIDNFEPWDPGWNPYFKDIAFGDDNTVYVINENAGIWRFHLAIDWEDFTHTSICTGFYPAVECGSDWTTQMPGWGNPDIPTLHNPQIGSAINDTLYTTGWSGKVRRLDFSD